HGPVLTRLSPDNGVLRSEQHLGAILFREALPPEGHVSDVQPFPPAASDRAADEIEWLCDLRQLQPVLSDHERGAGSLVARAPGDRAVAAADRGRSPGLDADRKSVV